MPTLRLPAPPCGSPPHHPRLGIVPGSAYRPPAPHWVPGTVHRVGPQIVAHCIGVRLGPRYQMLKSGPDCDGRCARTVSSNSCDPDPRPAPTSTHRHCAVAHTGKTATRSGQEPHQTPSTTDQRLCYEPRRLQMSSHTPNNPAVTSSTSANTPTNRIYSYLAGRLSGRLVSGSGRWGVPPPTNTVSAVGGAPSRTAARPSSARTAASQPSGLAAPNSAGV